MIKIEDYLTEVQKELTTLLSTQKASTCRNEKSIQDFFEHYPVALLPGLQDVQANYSIYGRLVISKPKFKSYDGDRRPDFLIVTSNSLNLYFNFIELEAPNKKIFKTSVLQPSPDFLEAYNQLKQWSTYNNNEVQEYCKNLLKTVFKENYDSRTEKSLHYNFILVYGFSDEVNDNGIRYNNLLNGYFNEKDFHHCTYSRIQEKIIYQRNLISVKINSAQKFKAMGATPFAKYGTDEWFDHHNIIDKAEIILQSKYLDDEEKIRLIAQINELDTKFYKEIITNLFGNGLQTISFSDIEV